MFSATQCDYISRSYYLSKIAYGRQILSVIVIIWLLLSVFDLAQSDHIKRLLLYNANLQLDGLCGRI